MYAKIDYEIALQGDILIDFHFIVPGLGEPLVLIRNPDKILIEPVSKIKNPYSSKKEALVVNSFMASAMIVTQSCDIERREYINLCPVFPVEEIRKKDFLKKVGESKIEDQIRQIRQQKVNYYLYLPKFKSDEISLDESYVDLQLFNSMPRENLKYYQRLISLSDKGRHWLSYKLSNYLGRPFI